MKNKIVQKTVGILIAFVFWIILSAVTGNGIIPFPWDVTVTTFELLLYTDALLHIGITVLRVLAAFFFSLFIGMIIGISRGMNSSLETITSPFISFFQGIPPILWALPLFFITGFFILSPVIVISLIVLPLVLVNITEGSKSISIEYKEMLRIYAPKHRFHIRDLLLPSLHPHVASAVKLGLILGLKAAIPAEFFTANDGIGFYIKTANFNAQIPLLFAWGLIIIILIFLFNRALNLLLNFFTLSRARIRKKEQTFFLSSGDDFTEYLAPRNPVSEIHLANIAFSYSPSPGTNAKLFQNLDLDVPVNNIAVISGDSGIGKTTLLKIISGILLPQQGSITKELTSSFLFQDDRLLPWYTIIHNVALPLLSNKIPKEAAFAAARYLLKKVGLEDCVLSFPDELSGGMKRRACLARCFAAQHGCMLLDEPFNGLQKQARKQLWGVFLELWNVYPCPVIIVTHYPEELPKNTSMSFYSLAGTPTKLIAFSS